MQRSTQVSQFRRAPFAESVSLSCSVLYYVRSYKHIEALWFANTANSLLWWTYVKAFWRALNSVFGEKIKFKTTLKGAPSPSYNLPFESVDFLQCSKEVTLDCDVGQRP